MWTRRISFILLFCLVASNCFGAEVLIRAQTHWMDAWTPAQVKKLTPEEKVSYDARSQFGDIIVIRPDGWPWGLEERLPRFVLVKIPDMTVEEAKQYEDSIWDTTDPEKPIMLRHRKWKIKATWIDTIISHGGEWTISKDVVVDYIEQKIL